MIENESLTELEAEAPPADTDQPAEDAGAEDAAGPRAKLVLKRAGAETEDAFSFGSPATIGRFDPSVGPIDVDLGTLDEGVYVSRKHARIVCENGVWRVEDLGSSNGTFVLRSDFEKVDSAEIADGDEIAFGNARFKFYVLNGAEPEAGEPAHEEDVPVELVEES
jgi:pSer/pThr/pTyr-binding forkhead associated (FHA) protein